MRNLQSNQVKRRIKTKSIFIYILYFLSFIRSLSIILIINIVQLTPRNVYYNAKYLYNIANVLVFNITRKSVLCMLWEFYVCCIKSDVTRCMVLYMCRMCQYGLQGVPWSHIGFMRLNAATLHYRRTVISLSVSLCK